MKNIFISFLLFIILGCTTATYKVIHKEYDDLENPFASDKLYFRLPPAATFIAQVGDSFYVEKIVSEKTGAYFILGIEYEGQRWRFMEGDVKIKTDINLYKFKDENPHRFVAGNLFEIIRVQIEPKIIADMINSQEAKIQFYGEPITLTEDNLKLLRQFYNEYVK